jgi:hypothetical protein
MKTDVIEVRTGGHETVHDITAECEKFARERSGGGDGLLHVFVPHATAGVALIELGAGSDRSCFRLETNGYTRTARVATGVRTCFPPSWRRMPRFPSSGAGWRLARGSRWPLWT